MQNAKETFRTFMAAAEFDTQEEAAKKLGMHPSTLSIRLKETEEGDASEDYFFELVQGLGFELNKDEIRKIVSGKAGQPLRGSFWDELVDQFENRMPNMLSAVSEIITSLGAGDIYTGIASLDSTTTPATLGSPIEIYDHELLDRLVGAVERGAIIRFAFLAKSNKDLESKANRLQKTVQESVGDMGELADNFHVSFCEDQHPLYLPSDRFIYVDRDLWKAKFCLRILRFGKPRTLDHDFQCLPLEVRSASAVSDFIKQRSWRSFADL